MTAAALVAHQIPGRIRLKIRSQKGNPKYFADTGRSLSGGPGVERVDANFRTASILLHHATDTPFSEIAQWAEIQGLFELADDQAAEPDSLRAVASGIESLDGEVRELTRGVADLRSLLFLLFVGMGLAQAARGQVLPEGCSGFPHLESADVLIET